ncbi:hypothetical protein XENOCAPTIV_005789 [Xenoophorus captivus]|uniref:Uncharacterized protein n=1 Tax=Xenoophorus captivus TaxID=1517983 RepID=A0ABV0Q504_9TELE
MLPKKIHFTYTFCASSGFIFGTSLIQKTVNFESSSISNNVALLILRYAVLTDKKINFIFSFRPSHHRPRMVKIKYMTSHQPISLCVSIKNVSFLVINNDVLACMSKLCISVAVAACLCSGVCKIQTLLQQESRRDARGRRWMDESRETERWTDRRKEHMESCG